MPIEVAAAPTEEVEAVPIEVAEFAATVPAVFDSVRLVEAGKFVAAEWVLFVAIVVVAIAAFAAAAAATVIIVDSSESIASDLFATVATE